MIALMFAAALSATPAALPQEAAPAATASRGVAGMCVRWDRRRRSKVAQAVVVQSTGNETLDDRMTQLVPQWDWPVGVDDYRGQWVGVWLAVGGATAPADDAPLPDCSALPDRSWAPAPAPAG